MSSNKEDESVLTAKDASEKSQIETSTAEQNVTSQFCSMSAEEDELTAEGLEDWVEEMGDGPRKVCLQSMLPLFIGGLGSISAGLILNLASTKLERVKETPQFIAVVPPLQGMKGNLDMTFTSRLSTLSHSGALDAKEGRVLRILRTISLLLGQATFFTMFAMLMSYFLDMPKRDPFYCAYEAFFFLASVAQASMMVSCFVMTFIMVTIVIIARKCRMNPDNMATPFASSIGDLLTIGLMLGFCYAIRPAVDQHIAVAYSIPAIALVLVPVWVWISWKDEGARKAAKSQWVTLLISTMIASGAGALLEWGEKKYPDITAYQPMISGIAGNRAALMASRLSSMLNVQQFSSLDIYTRLNFFKYYFMTKNKETRVAQMLLYTSVFFQIAFFLLTHFIAHFFNPLHFTLLLIGGYLIAAFLQVFFLVWLSQLVSYCLWKMGIDPDMHAIPILTSVGDVMGTSLLVGLFHTLDAISDTAVRRAVPRMWNDTIADGCPHFG